MDTFPKDVSRDFDLDALMLRVREAAMAGITSAGPGATPAGEEATGRDFDLVRVIEAQGEWNEQTRKSIAALVECFRNLRDDWMDAHARLSQEVSQLSAVVHLMRNPTEADVSRSNKPAVKSKRRRPAKRINGGKRRS